MPRTLPLSRHLGSSPVRWASRSSSDDRSGTSAPSSFTTRRRSSCSWSPAAQRPLPEVDVPQPCPPPPPWAGATAHPASHATPPPCRPVSTSAMGSIVYPGSRLRRRSRGDCRAPAHGRSTGGAAQGDPGPVLEPWGVAAPLRPAHNLGFKRRRVIVAPPFQWSMWNGNSPKLQTLYIYIGRRYHHHHQPSFAQN